MLVSELMRWVQEKIATSGLDKPVGDLVVAAMAGGDALDAYLDAGALPDSDEAAYSTATTGGTFLTSIEVEGFRGIGQATKVEFAPRPGLRRE